MAEIKIENFSLNLAELSPDMLAQSVAADAGGVTLTFPHSYTVELPEVGLAALTIGRLQLRFDAGLVRQLGEALPNEVAH
jgi:hypothetical protein